MSFDLATYDRLLWSLAWKHARPHVLATADELYAEAASHLPCALAQWNGSGSKHGFIYWYVECRLIDHLRTLYGRGDRVKVRPLYFDDLLPGGETPDHFYPATHNEASIVSAVDHRLRMERLSPADAKLLTERLRGDLLIRIAVREGVTEARISQRLQEAKQRYTTMQTTETKYTRLARQNFENGFRLLIDHTDRTAFFYRDGSTQELKLDYKHALEVKENLAGFANRIDERGQPQSTANGQAGTEAPSESDETRWLSAAAVHEKYGVTWQQVGAWGRFGSVDTKDGKDGKLYADNEKLRAKVEALPSKRTKSQPEPVQKKEPQKQAREPTPASAAKEMPTPEPEKPTPPTGADELYAIRTCVQIIEPLSHNERLRVLRHVADLLGMENIAAGICKLIYGQ